MIGFLFASPSFPQIAVALHASWDPDLTDNQAGYCVTSGNVAVPYFHFVVAYKYPVIGVSVDWYRVEELPEQHIPRQVQFDYPSGDYGAPPCATMLVSDPQNWDWLTFPCLPDPIVGFALHNTSYRIKVQYRYFVMVETEDPDFPFDFIEYGPYQETITVNVKNMVVESSEEMKVLRWDPSRGIDDTTFSYRLECAQTKQAQVTLRIYSTDGMKVYELTEWKKCPGSYSFKWDGTMNFGFGYGYPPDSYGYPLGEGGSDLAPEGLYVFDIVAVAVAPSLDYDYLRSRMLKIGEHDVIPVAPKLYRAEYILRGTDGASDAWVEVYDPALMRIAGPKHGPYHVIPPDVTPQDMDWNRTDIGVNLGDVSPQPYRFVFWARDANLAFYKNHRNKTTLTNQQQWWLGWLLAFGFHYNRTYSVDPSGSLPQLPRELDSSGMPAEIGKIVKHIVRKNPKTDKLEKILGYSSEDFVYANGIREPLKVTSEIGSDEFKNKINRIVDASFHTGIVYFCGHGGMGKAIAIPNATETAHEVFGLDPCKTHVSSLANNLHKVRVFYMGSCRTCTNLYGQGLVAAIAAKGAKAVVGFHIPISGIANPPSRDADVQFFKFLAGSMGTLWGIGKFAGKTVIEAAQDACKYVRVGRRRPKNWWEVYGIAGDPNTRLW